MSTTLTPPTGTSDIATPTRPANTAIASNAGVELSAVAAWCNVSDDLAHAAATATAPRLVVSGRLASGKDTVAAAVMETLGHPDSVQVSFATALRREVGDLLDIVRRHDNLDDAVAAVAAYASVPIDDAVETTTLLRQAVETNPDITPYTRTREMRLALQVWGTNVRRRHDNEYWVKRGAADVIAALATGKAVHITDARFVNEVETARALGFWAVRLEVDLDIRAERLRLRDGLQIDPASENHPSEVELETYDQFDQRVSNNGPLTDTVAAVIAAMR